MPDAGRRVGVHPLTVFHRMGEDSARSPVSSPVVWSLPKVLQGLLGLRSPTLAASPQPLPVLIFFQLRSDGKDWLSLMLSCLHSHLGNHPHLHTPQRKLLCNYWAAEPAPLRVQVAKRNWQYCLELREYLSTVRTAMDIVQNVGDRVLLTLPCSVRLAKLQQRA